MEFHKKKQMHCNSEEPADQSKGDQWDLTAVDVERRFVVSMVLGKRTRDTTRQLVKDFAGRTGKVPPALITTDDCNTYADQLLDQYGETVVPEGADKPGRSRKPFKQWPAGSVYATVNQTYAKGKVAAVHRKIVLGTEEDLARVLNESSTSREINTSFVER